MKKIIFILCPGHCGSTLLGYLLGSHSKATYVGEIVNLKKYLDSHKRSVCGVCGGNCSFWHDKVNENGILSRFQDSDHWKHRLLRRIFPKRYDDDIYTRIFEVTGSDILVDSSHFASWASNAATRSRNAQSIIIRMIRDGRAFLASQKRKGREVSSMSHIWSERMRDINILLQNWPDDQLISLQYEKLVSETESCLRELTTKLELDFEPEMLNYWQHEHHNVGGNTGTRLSVVDFASKSLIGRNSRKDIDYYEANKQKIFIDNRWKYELSREDLETFDRIAGEINFEIGYTR